MVEESASYVEETLSRPHSPFGVRHPGAGAAFGCGAELVDEALLDAARQALDEDAETVTRDVTLSLIYRDRAWWVTPDAALLEMISGLA